MDDRQLLELAARAAGYQIEWVRNSGCHYRCEEDVGREEWCPLDNDGDALRLAVTLGFRLELDNAWSRSHAQQIPSKEWVTEPHNGDPFASTRRAIVRAAADIGKAMQENS